MDMHKLRYGCTLEFVGHCLSRLYYMQYCPCTYIEHTNFQFMDKTRYIIDKYLKWKDKSILCLITQKDKSILGLTT